MKLLDQLTSYLLASKEEFRKVSWPTRKETIRYSALVIGVSVLIAAFFATLDMGFTQLVDVVVTQRNATRATTSAPVTSQPVVPDTVPTQPTSPTLDLKGLQTAPVKVDSTTLPAKK